MSLSEELHAELARIEPRRTCDRLAELSALFHTAGRAHLEGRGRISVHLDLASSATARRAFALLKGFEIDSEIRTYRQHAFARPTRYQLRVEGVPRALQLLNEAGVLDATLAPIDSPPPRVVARSCCRGAYLRGAVLGGGSLSGPSSLHLEIRTAGPEGARFLVETARREGIELRARERERHALVYSKSAERIGELLALVGASEAVLAIAERSVMGQLRSDANRLANADHANLVRVSRAAHAQLEAVRRLKTSGELARLSQPLRAAAELRLSNPLASLSELARKAGTPKPTLHRRLKTLQRRAEETKSGGRRG
ncbi:MAG: DNA-binding protein WhiA [Gaiellaceae bacterium]